MRAPGEHAQTASERSNSGVLGEWRSYGKAPAGGVAWPAASFPQHATTPLVCTAQVWPAYAYPPAVSEVKVPVGGADWPSVSSPQQAAVPFVLTPQVCDRPADTVAKVPAGGVAFPLLSDPQQATAPSVLTRS